MSVSLLLSLLPRRYRTVGLGVSVVRSRHRIVSASTASLLNIPEAITANTEEDCRDRASFGADKDLKKPRNRIPAIGDTALLRKRTVHLLRIASENYPSGVGSNDQLSNNMKVDKKTFHWLIDSWAVSCELDASDKAHALLTSMEDFHLSSIYGTIRPDVRSLTEDINAISRSGSADAGDMTDNIFKRMEALYQSGKNPTATPMVG
jgi:hypothetical protein